MARPKDVDNRKKRMKSIILSKKAFIILKQHIGRFGSFDFSAWVSDQVEAKFGGDQEPIIMAQINDINEARDKAYAEEGLKVEALNKVLADLRAQKRARGEKTLSAWDSVD